MDSTLQLLANYATSLTYEKLPEEVVHHVKRRTIDALGCAFGGYFMEPPRIAREYALESIANPGAIVFGTSHRTAPDLAAFANSVMVRYIDFNDTDLALDGGHPSDNIPAVLAAADYVGTDARTAIVGIVLAYEVEGRIAETGRLRLRGWDHVTGVALSSAAGAGKAMSLTPEQMANALAIAATCNISLRQTRMGALSIWKGCAAGNACRSGVFAAILAKRGITGPAEAFEGRHGFLNQVTGPLEFATFGGNGHPFKVEDAKFKYFPADYEAQCAIQLALDLRQALAGQVDEIEKIVVKTYALAVMVTADTPDKWQPTSRETADHSLPYILALAFSKGSIWLDDFTEELITDPKLRALMQKIEVYADDECTRAYPEANCFRMEVTTRSGERYLREARYAKGHPKNPMTDQEIEAKFRRLAGPVLKPRQMDQLLDRLWHLEDLKDLRELFRLCEV